MGRPLRQKGGAFLRRHFIEPLTPGGIDGMQTAQIEHQFAAAERSSGSVPAATEFLDIAFSEFTGQLQAQRADAVVNIVLQTGLIARGRRYRSSNSLGNRGNGCRLLQINGAYRKILSSQYRFHIFHFR